MSIEKYEDTLVLIKPDAVRRQLAQKIIAEFESNSFSVTVGEEILPTNELVKKHFEYRPNTFLHTAEKTLKKCQKLGLDISLTTMYNKSVEEVADMIEGFYHSYLMSGIVIPLIVSGRNSIKIVKGMCGNTFPSEADPNSLRGKYASDSFELCIKENRAAQNILHAAEDNEEAIHQLKLWFPHYKIN